MPGRKKTKHENPGPHASKRKRAQYRYINPLIEALNQNGMSQAELAELIGLEPFTISQHFFKTDAFKLPSLPELLAIHDALQNSRPANQSGRVFNYVEMFEGQGFTSYEKRLMQDRERLAREVQRLTILLKQNRIAY